MPSFCLLLAPCLFQYSGSFSLVNLNFSVYSFLILLSCSISHITSLSQKELLKKVYQIYPHYSCDAVTLLKECVTDVTRMLFCHPVTFANVTGMSQPSQDSTKHCFIKELSRSLQHTRLSQELCHRSRSSFSCSSPSVA